MPQRKAKPKFEIPAETERPDVPVGWVYRADEAQSPRQPEALPRRFSNSSPLCAAGMGVLLLGAGTIGVVSLAALGLIALPISFVLGTKRG
jgi:hypothetical protein